MHPVQLAIYHQMMVRQRLDTAGRRFPERLRSEAEPRPAAALRGWLTRRRPARRPQPCTGC
jgi:hypothetical protein